MALDDSNGPAVSAAGGSIVPENRAPIAIARFQKPKDSPAVRYELREAFAEVTYRSNSFTDMAAKADRLGNSRFVAITLDGRRTTIRKTGGAWQRDPESSRSPERPVAPSLPREEPQPAPKLVHIGIAPAPARSTENKAIAEIDNQAERRARTAQLEADLADRYLIKRATVRLGQTPLGQTEYRFRGDSARVAFTESTFRLTTDTNSPSVARSMIDLAEARDWRTLRVAGNEEFKRLVWLEASVRGVKAVGYEPNSADLQVLQKGRDSRLVNRIEHSRVDPAGTPPPAEKGSPRGSGGRKAVLAAIEAVLVAKQVPDKQREAVMAAAAENLAQRLRQGQTFRVKVYDKAAPSQRPIPTPTPEQQRIRDRAPPTR